MKLPPEWREFIGLLCSHRARFLVVGAHALAAHGRPRATQDIDILVEPTRANARRVCSALADFGFTALAKEVEAFATPDRMATLGMPPLRIDIMTSISGVSFRQAWRGRVTANLDGLGIGFLGRAEFLRNKTASGRPKDLLDIALLDEVAPPARRGRKARRTRPRVKRRPRI
jgi:hypothetical protein